MLKTTRKYKRKQFVLYTYISDLGNAMYSIVREDLMPFRPVQVILVGSYSACAAKLSAGWTPSEKKGVDVQPIMYAYKK
jgi:hypothetical protein